eukprot:CAMPEP_0201475934 /NCGR_PEP_ID=MMETSP0151_2-20130828/1239_1 /ASSEMBLY_ACC=CAM_ASM_000257 /TAXON_ID=200890 /ORGANISM="Paramoeba atlantica, Strain 621/1 / CCAP 1560/9" /LENGTH=234 /DNA_ID=CAMNT_0047856147 /DNA_START=52 /DNA_END=756 /DNA_ORIENTATION=-
MVRHNNRIVKNHFRYHWHPEASQKGHVKVLLGQAKAAQRRREQRKKKALAVFPRPVSGPLRPVTRCETIRYNMKRRLGRGFTKEELKAVGLCPAYARTIGVSVDHRRVNKSEEGLQENITRLKEYLSRLVVLPRKARKVPKSKQAAEGKTKVGKGEMVDLTQVAQDRTRKSPLLLETQTVPREAPRELTEQEKKRHIFQFLRKSYRDEYLVGVREARAKAKEEKAAEEAAGKKK